MRSLNKHTTSVVIPHYNCAAYLQEAVQSVLNQTYQNFELLIVDDGSTDGSVDIVRSEIIPMDNRIQLIEQENLGVAEARNRGAAASKGEFVAFLDADDYWHPSKLEVQLTCLTNHKDSQACFSAFNVWEPKNSRYPNPLELLESDIPISEIDERFTGYIYRQLLHDVYVWTSTFLCYRKFFNSFGGFDGTYAVGEDYHLWLRMAAKHKFIKCAHPLALYRKTPNSLTNNISERNYGLLVFENAEKEFGLKAPDGTGMEFSEANARKADLAFMHGYQCFWGSRPDLASKSFRQSLNFRPSAKALLYLALSNRILNAAMIEVRSAFGTT